MLCSPSSFSRLAASIVFLAPILSWVGAPIGASAQEAQREDYDYIVVGSGPGGGTLAARLAQAGQSTLLIEAGSDMGNTTSYQIPGFQAVAGEDPEMSWRFFVNHYPDLAYATRDSKFVYDTPYGREYVGLTPPPGSRPKGVLYPRAGTLGGCASHNALIWISPHESDWERIVATTGDTSWQAHKMKRYFTRVENCQYNASPLWHGLSGWLSVSSVLPSLVGRDHTVLAFLITAAKMMGKELLWGLVPGVVQGVTELLSGDPNSGAPNRDSSEGVFQVPITTKNGARNGPRDFILETVGRHFPLTVWTETFVTRVLFDQRSRPVKALGVEYVNGKNAYRASPLHGRSRPPRGPRAVYAKKEVIISGGAFNTPQILMLSGIGPADHLRSMGIQPLANLPGVGRNLQDRYEVGVVGRATNGNLTLLRGCTFDAQPHDQCYAEWAARGWVSSGAYTSNGLPIAMVKRSKTAKSTDTDLFIFGGPIRFTGYFPGWDKSATGSQQYFSWYALKAHTRNNAGTVHLRSRDPFDMPIIDFNYFESGNNARGEASLDLESLVEAVKFARATFEMYRVNVTLPGIPKLQFTEESPGPYIRTDEQIRDWIRREAWGHHPCCTAAMGRSDSPMTVIDSQFRVRGTKNLRVVDASIFPEIPGVFIVSAVYMIGEKAADVILNQNSTVPFWWPVKT